MPNATARQPETVPHRTEPWILLIIAGSVALLHLITNGRYGFHRDEFQFLSDARHLDWGFVAYPPLTPFLEHIGLAFFGVSLVWLRLFSVLAQSLAILVSGLMASELGGRRLAQGAAALAVALSPLPLFEGTEFQYSSFDYLWWILAAYCVIRVLKSDDARWWLGVGVALGLGLLTKYSIVFYIAGILGGMALTGARRYFLSKWFWAGFSVALLLFLPNFLWQMRHEFISYQFLQHIHARDVRQGRADGFLVDQIRICINVFAAPLAIAGLIWLMRSRRYRLIAWMYLIPLALFFLAKGRGYYLAAAYPMLLASGATVGEQWLATIARPWRLAIQNIFFTGLLAVGIYACAIILPLAPDGPLRQFALARNGDLREEFGWEELVRTVAGIRDKLPPEQQASLGIVTQNYGEQGAIEILGPAYRLPVPIGATNSAWLRGYPSPAPTTFIALGMSEKHAEEIFTNCRLAGHNGNSQGVPNEESEEHPDIFLCGPPRLPWPELWKNAINFG